MKQFTFVGSIISYLVLATSTYAASGNGEINFNCNSPEFNFSFTGTYSNFGGEDSEINHKARVGNLDGQLTLTHDGKTRRKKATGQIASNLRKSVLEVKLTIDKDNFFKETEFLYVTQFSDNKVYPENGVPYGSKLAATTKVRTVATPLLSLSNGGDRISEYDDRDKIAGYRVPSLIVRGTKLKDHKCFGSVTIEEEKVDLYSEIKNDDIWNWYL